MSKYHSNGQMIKQDWLDRLTLKEIQKNIKSEKEASKFFYMSIELAQIKCEETKYSVLYYEEVIALYKFIEEKRAKLKFKNGIAFSNMVNID
jgi:hypothetical protein